MSNHIHTTDTICALSTPTGMGALGIIRLSGSQAINIAETFFSKKLHAASSHTVLYGKIKVDEEIIDEVVLTLFKGPNSFTGEDVIEISCHGSPYILQRVLELILDRGARLAQPGEYTMRAFLNGKMDLTQAEAVADLIASGSQAAHTQAMRQMRGGFSSEIRELREQLIHFASLIELELDFAEEDVEFADRTQMLELLKRVQTLVQKLMASFQLGNAIKNGVPVVIVGKPNVGKSTLLNALLNEQKAIVSEIAGTTRDVIEDEMVIAGVRFRFIDTAGIRESEDTIEKIGVERAFEQVQRAAIILYLFDVHEMTVSDLKESVAELNVQEGQELLLVGNKIDKEDQAAITKEFAALQNCELISAKEGINLEKLQARLLELSHIADVDLQSTVVTNARHHAALRATDEALTRIFEGLETQLPSDLIAQDIRQALHYLGEITGQISSEDLLDNIFRNFCIGK